MSVALDHWHAIVRTRDIAGLGSLLADDVVFESPVVHTPQLGKAIALKYLQGALLVLNTGAFEYVNEWTGPSSAVLEFVTVVDRITINGVDIIDWNAAEKITHFKVMLRPLKAVNIVHQKMGELLMPKVS